MKKMLIAVALTIALPAAAFAQGKSAAPAPATNGHAGHNMQGMNMQNMSCKDLQAMTGAHGGQMAGMQMDHSKMDHSKMASCADAPKSGAQQAPANPHQNHKL